MIDPDAEIVELLLPWDAKGTLALHCRKCNVVFGESDKAHVCEERNMFANDPVNAPQHYTTGGIETIDYLKAKMSSEMFKGFLLGNVLKYTSRYQFKNGKQDLQKAQWYLNKLLEGEK